MLAGKGAGKEGTSSDLGRAIALFAEGKATAEQLRKGATTPSEKAEVAEAIRLKAVSGEGSGALAGNIGPQPSPYAPTPIGDAMKRGDEQDVQDKKDIAQTEMNQKFVSDSISAMSSTERQQYTKLSMADKKAYMQEKFRNPNQ